MNQCLRYTRILIEDEIMRRVKELDGKNLALSQGYLMGLSKALNIVDYRIKVEEDAEKVTEEKANGNS